MKKLSLKLTVWSFMVIVYLLSGNARANSVSNTGNQEVSNQTLTTQTEAAALCEVKAEVECQKEIFGSAPGGTASEMKDYNQCVEEKQAACEGHPIRGLPCEVIKELALKKCETDYNECKKGKYCSGPSDWCGCNGPYLQCDFEAHSMCP